MLHSHLVMLDTRTCTFVPVIRSLHSEIPEQVSFELSPPFLVSPAHEQGEFLLTVVFVCLLACGRIIFLQEISTRWLYPDLNTPQEVPKDTLET